MAVIAAALVGCSSSPAAQKALSASGAATSSTLGVNDATPGQEYWFAFPDLSNQSDTPVRVIGFAMARVADNVKVAGYFAYDPDRVGGIHLTYIRGADDAGVTLSDPKWAEPQHFTIAAHSDSDTEVMARTELVGDPLAEKPDLSGCTVIYDVEGQRNTHTFPCHYSLGPGREHTRPGDTSVIVTNNTSHQITEYGCPHCGSEGSHLASHTVDGWEIPASDNPQLSVQVPGHHRSPCPDLQHQHGGTPGGGIPVYDHLFTVTDDGTCR